MSPKTPPPPTFQRNALAPSLLAAMVLVVAPALIGNEWFLLIRFVVAILALIVAWFAIQAKHWWWAPVMVAIAVIWNPIYPFAFAGQIWTVAQFAGAVVFLAAGATIKSRRS